MWRILLWIAGRERDTTNCSRILLYYSNVVWLEIGMYFIFKLDKIWGITLIKLLILLRFPSHQSFANYMSNIENISISLFTTFNRHFPLDMNSFVKHFYEKYVECWYFVLKYCEHQTFYSNIDIQPETSLYWLFMLIWNDAQNIWLPSSPAQLKYNFKLNPEYQMQFGPESAAALIEFRSDSSSSWIFIENLHIVIL